MRTAAAIPAIGATHGSELIAHEVFNPRPAMAAATKDPDLVNEIAFFHYLAQ